MKNSIQLSILAVTVSLAGSCAGMLDKSAANAASAKSFDPLASYTTAKKLAGDYTTNISAVSLTATRKASAKSLSSGSSSFTWIWTLEGQDGTFVDVEVSPAGATVLDHEQRALAGQPGFEPAVVSVNGADALLIANASKMSGQPSDLYLVSNNGSAPRWTIGYASGALSIDGESGSLVR